MAQKPSYEELEHRIKDLESELLKYKGGISEDFKSLADQMLVGVYQYDLLSRKFTLLNKRCYEFFKFEEGGKEVVTTKSVLLHIHPRYRDKVRNASAESLAPGSDGGEVEYCLLREDGSEKWMQDRWIVVRDNSGRPVAIQGMVRDDTERKQAEEALRGSEERLAAFMESATDGFILFDSELNHIAMNKVALEITGFERKDVIGKNIIDTVPNIKESGRYDEYKKVMKTGASFNIPNMTFHPLAGDKHIELKAFKVGEGLGIIFTDITERKQAEEALAKSETFLNATGQIAKVGGWEIDGETQRVGVRLILRNKLHVK